MLKRIACFVLALMLSAMAASAETMESKAELGSADAPKIEMDAAQDEAVRDEAAQEIINIIGDIQSVEVAEEAAEPEQAPLRLDGIIVGIDPGHQAHANSDREPVAPDSKEKKAKVSSGTSGVRTGIAEYVTDLEVALKLRDALEALGCTVYMTRETHDVDISNLERATMMNDLGAQLVLRIHCDGSTDKSANGIGMFVRKTGVGQEESETAAGYLLESMTETTGARARGIFKRDTYTGLNWSVVPCVLIEMGFMSNPAEDEKLNDPEYQEKLVEGMVNGICAYFER